MPITPRPSGLPRRIPAWAWKWLKWRKGGNVKPTPKPKPKPVKMLMFDDVNVSLIPKTAEAIAGYVDGHYATWAKVKAGWPHAKKLMIAVFAQDNGDCLDVEPGDASAAQAPAWVKRQLANWSKSHHDVARPVGAEVRAGLPALDGPLRPQQGSASLLAQVRVWAEDHGARDAVHQPYARSVVGRVAL
jgi:hypothetical protein